MAFVRNYSRYDSPVVFHHALEAFLHEPIHEGINVIDYGHTLLELRILNRHSPTTVVVFHAAVDLNQATIPLFTGEQLTQDSEANVVFVSDPMLELGCGIAWFTGDNTCRLQTDLLTILSKVQKDFNAKDLIFCGSSAGGFAALHYSHCCPESLAIVSNPQTNISKYHPTPVDHYVKTVWHSSDISTVPAVTNLIAEYQTSFPNYVAYLANQSDDFHNTHHLLPWDTATAYAPQRRRYLLGDWGEGHAAPPVYLLKGILDFAISVNGNWQDFFADENFTPQYEP